MPNTCQPRMRRASGPQKARGFTMLVVLVLLSVMLLSGISLARMTDVAVQASGSSSFREASLHASEVGTNTAFAATQALTDENTDSGGWYFATPQAVDAAGLPTASLAGAPQIAVGPYTVRYVVERLCSVATLTDPLNECLVRQEPQLASASANSPKVDNPNARQFRTTVQVTGPKGTTTFVQTLLQRMNTP